MIAKCGCPSSASREEATSVKGARGIGFCPPFLRFTLLTVAECHSVAALYVPNSSPWSPLIGLPIFHCREQRFEIEGRVHVELLTEEPAICLVAATSFDVIALH